MGGWVTLPSLPLFSTPHFLCFKSRNQPTPLLQHMGLSILLQCFCVAALFAPGPLMRPMHRRNVCHGGLDWAS